jgi:hypothetical protein
MIVVIQQEQHLHIASCGGSQEGPDAGASMVNGIPVEDAVAQLRLELQMVQSRIRSDAASVAGHMFELYEYTDGWEYVMYMSALYSLTRPDGPVYDTLLVEESN